MACMVQQFAGCTDDAQADLYVSYVMIIPNDGTVQSPYVASYIRRKSENRCFDSTWSYSSIPFLILFLPVSLENQLIFMQIRKEIFLKHTLRFLFIFFVISNSLKQEEFKLFLVDFFSLNQTGFFVQFAVTCISFGSFF